MLHPPRQTSSPSILRFTETEAATFTDCVNCLIAYTNNPHSLDVALNSIAFLRFCALQLAAGGIGDVEKLPEGAVARTSSAAFRIRPRGDAAAGDVTSAAAAAATSLSAATSASKASTTAPGDVAQSNHTTSATVGSLRFTDKEQHMYYWFPLLAGLSELTFDPRPQVRTSALDVLFDTLRFHGGSFTPAFWLRVFDSVLLPIFDVVRAEITDTTTFTDERRRAEADRWLYATCTRTLQYIVDLVAQYHAGVEPLLARLLHLLLGFATRPHAELAAVGVAALSRLTLALAPRLDEPGWRALLDAYAEAARETLPDVAGLMQRRSARFKKDDAEGRVGAGPAAGAEDGAAGDAVSPPEASAASASANGAAWSLGRGAGARRLAEASVHAGVALLLVQAAEAACVAAAETLPPSAAAALLDLLAGAAGHAARVDADLGLRHSLALAQAADGVAPDRALPDPPLLRLEAAAATAHLSALGALGARGSAATAAACDLRPRLAAQCLRNLERYEGAGAGEEGATLAPLATATLTSLRGFDDDAFRAHVHDLFPRLVALIAAEGAPPELRRALSDLFLHRVGAMLV